MNENREEEERSFYNITSNGVIWQKDVNEGVITEEKEWDWSEREVSAERENGRGLFSVGMRNGRLSVCSIYVTVTNDYIALGT